MRRKATQVGRKRRCGASVAQRKLLWTSHATFARLRPSSHSARPQRARLVFGRLVARSRSCESHFGNPYRALRRGISSAAGEGRLAQQFESVCLEAKLERFEFRYPSVAEQRRAGIIRRPAKFAGIVQIQHQSPIHFRGNHDGPNLEQQADSSGHCRDSGQPKRTVATKPDWLGAGQPIFKDKRLVQQIAIAAALAKKTDARQAVGGLHLYA